MDEISKYKILFCKHEGKRQLGRPGHRWENNSSGLARNSL